MIRRAAQQTKTYTGELLYVMQVGTLRIHWSVAYRWVPEDAPTVDDPGTPAHADNIDGTIVAVETWDGATYRIMEASAWEKFHRTSSADYAYWTIEVLQSQFARDVEDLPGMAHEWQERIRKHVEAGERVF